MKDFSRRVVGYLGAVVVLVLTWWLVARLIASPALPGPVSAFAALVESWAEIWPQALISLMRVVVAMALGAIVAVPLGLALGRSPRADALFAPIIFVSYPIPKIVFLPVLLVLLGLGNAPKIALIWLIVFFQLLVTARDASRSVSEGAILSVRSLGAGRWDIARHVVFPASLPEIFTALRIGTGTAVAVLFIAEATAGTSGLGWFIVDAWGRIDYPSMWAGIIAMALLGVVLYEALDAVERWATRWRKAAR